MVEKPGETRQVRMSLRLTDSEVALVDRYKECIADGIPTGKLNTTTIFTAAAIAFMEKYIADHEANIKPRGRPPKEAATT